MQADLSDRLRIMPTNSTKFGSTCFLCKCLSWNRYDTYSSGLSELKAVLDFPLFCLQLMSVSSEAYVSWSGSEVEECDPIPWAVQTTSPSSALLVLSQWIVVFIYTNPELLLKAALCSLSCTWPSHWRHARVTAWNLCHTNGTRIRGTPSAANPNQCCVQAQGQISLACL